MSLFSERCRYRVNRIRKMRTRRVLLWDESGVLTTVPPPSHLNTFGLSVFGVIGSVKCHCRCIGKCDDSVHMQAPNSWGCLQGMLDSSV